MTSRRIRRTSQAPAARSSSRTTTTPSEKGLITTSAANRYRYNGKEQLRFEGINLDYDDWIEYDKQINNTPYKLILQRQ